MLLTGALTVTTYQVLESRFTTMFLYSYADRHQMLNERGTFWVGHFGIE
jgi:hypothetical protein